MARKRHSAEEIVGKLRQVIKPPHHFARLC